MGDDEEAALDALFLSLSVDEKRTVLMHLLNKKRLAPLRNIIKTIAFMMPDLASYTNLRCACKHFWKWLPPALSKEVLENVLMPHVNRFRNFLQNLPDVTTIVNKTESNTIRLEVKRSHYPFYVGYRIARATGFIRSKSTRIIGSVFYDCFEDFVSQETGEEIDYKKLSFLQNPMKDTQVKLNRKRLKRF